MNKQPHEQADLTLKPHNPCIAIALQASVTIALQAWVKDEALLHLNHPKDRFALILYKGLQNAA